MPGFQRRSRSTQTRTAIARGLSTLLASLLALALALVTPATAQAAPDTDPTVSWSIFFTSPVTATVSGASINSGDPVAPGSTVVFEIDLRSGYTYDEPPTTSGCDVEYTSSSSGTDVWTVEDVTEDCSVEFSARWASISPYNLEWRPELAVGEPYSQQFRQLYGYGPFFDDWTWSSGGLPPGLTLNAETGELAGTPTTPGTYNFDVVVTNEAGHSESEIYEIYVVNVFSSLDDLTVNDGQITVVPSFDDTRYYAWVPYEIDEVTVAPTATDLNATVTVNGEAVSRGSSSSPISLPVGDTDITIKVTGDRTTTYTLDTTRQTPSVAVSVPSLLEGTVDVPFEPVSLSASGGEAPYTFDVESGGLPNGMSLSSTGELSGTPREAGNFDVVFRATDNEGREGPQAATLTIAGYLLPAFTTQPTHADVALGETTEFSVAVTGHPEPSVAWQVSTDNGATWQHLSVDSHAEVSTGGLSVSVTATTSNHGNQYRAFASNIEGSTASDAATLSAQGAVTFNTGNGSAVPSETVTLGETVDEPTEPIRQGHTFNGWYTNAGGSGAPYDFTTELTGNLTLYAGWNELPVAELDLEVDSETFNVNQGETVTITAEGIAEDGHSFGDVTDEITLTSSVATDRIDGNTVTFVTASPHVITVAHADGAQAEIVFSVTPTPVDEEPAETQPAPGSSPEAAGGLTATGADGWMGALLAALLLIGIGGGTLWLGRRRA